MFQPLPPHNQSPCQYLHLHGTLRRSFPAAGFVATTLLKYSECNIYTYIYLINTIYVKQIIQSNNTQSDVLIKNALILRSSSLVQMFFGDVTYLLYLNWFSPPENRNTNPISFHCICIMSKKMQIHFSLYLSKKRHNRRTHKQGLD